MLIQIFKSIQKVSNLVYKPINQHHFCLAAFHENQNIDYNVMY